MRWPEQMRVRRAGTEWTFARIEASGLERWLAGLREELVSKTYRPDPVRRVSDRVTVPWKPGNSGGGKGPDFERAFEVGEVEVIGDEPCNT